MQRRFLTIWFRYLETDYFTRRQPSLQHIPFVLSSPDHGRMMVTAINKSAQQDGIYIGMTVADARACNPSLAIMNDQSELALKVLTGIAGWCIRFTPAAAVDPPDGLTLDISGCAHLWGGEKQYLADIHNRLKAFGYDVRLAIADTIGAAWAVTRYAKEIFIIEKDQQKSAIVSLPVNALRLENETAERLEKLGLRRVSDFIDMPRPSLRRRFGLQLLQRLDQALGVEEEWILPVQPIEPYQERLPCLEPIVTATGIEMALQKLLDIVCSRLQQQQKGLRMASFKGYRIDGKMVQIEIGTNRPTCHTKHLFKLFEIKIETLEPAAGIELFTLDASGIEDLPPQQEKLWDDKQELNDIALSELLDRIGGKIGADRIHRYMPDEHYWPERSFKPAISLDEKLQTTWRLDRPRPLQLLAKPDPIEVTAPIPDYPPMLFRYKGQLHKIVKADGPERIEQEWWIQEGQHRDYYAVEDEAGRRYWLFRSGHYDASQSFQWFLHGFFA